MTLESREQRTVRVSGARERRSETKKELELIVAL